MHNITGNVGQDGFLPEAYLPKVKCDKRKRGVQSNSGYTWKEFGPECRTYSGLLFVVQELCAHTDVE